VAIRANPRLVEELESYGAQDVNKCYHCGNCSAVCPFSQGPFLFPRKSMRYLQMGLEQKLLGTLEPWLCYYCGECSEQCPRDADPGETMMSMRRWLTSRYDFTGISRLFYRSWWAELGAIVVVALLTLAGFTWYGMRVGNLNVYDGPGAFLPSHAVHRFDWAFAAVLSSLLLVNCARMWWFSIGRNELLHIPLRAYLRQAYLLPLHFFTQRRYRQCGNKRPWAIHLILMASYVTMLVLIMFFLKFFQEGPAIDWRAHVFGYAATAGLLGTTLFAMRGRLLKREPHYRHSHETDWIFLALLLYVATTGIVQHILHRAGLDRAANITYLVHMMGVVPMLGLEVPFSKWSHLAYRPLGMYFSALETEAQTARVAASDTLAGAIQRGTTAPQAVEAA
jgi:quinone-modifying oxidoreductase subunit QmoC